MSLKALLLSYLCLYGPSDGVAIADLRMLFRGPAESEGATGCEDLEVLDLTNLLSDRCSLADVHRYVASCPPTAADLSKKLDGLAILGNDGGGDEHIAPEQPAGAENGGSKEKKKKKGKAREDVVAVAESWEDEDSDTPAAPLSAPLRCPRFPQLTRLSLANPGPRASWAHLLELAPHLSRLTHLSLAYWPTPTTTPNAATTSMVSRHAGPVDFGGSSVYSALDDDWGEAANILRRVSNATYCLRWLDLEGCTWVAALTWGADDSRARRLLRQDRGASLWDENEDSRYAAKFPFPASPAPSSSSDGGADSDRATDGSGPGSGIGNTAATGRRHGDIQSQHRQPLPARAAPPPPTGVDWNAAWRAVERVNLSQGWIPTDVTAIRRMPAGTVGVELLGHLRDCEARGVDPNGVEAPDPAPLSPSGSPPPVPSSPTYGSDNGARGVAGAGAGATPTTVVPVRHWLEREKEARRVAAAVLARRRAAGGRWCRFEHGWRAPPRVPATPGAEGGTGVEGAGVGAGAGSPPPVPAALAGAAAAVGGVGQL